MSGAERETMQRMPAPRRTLATLAVVALASLTAACDNTAEGVLEDTQDNVDAVDQELEEAGDGD